MCDLCDLCAIVVSSAQSVLYYQCQRGGLEPGDQGGTETMRQMTGLTFFKVEGECPMNATLYAKGKGVYLVSIGSPGAGYVDPFVEGYYSLKATTAKEARAEFAEWLSRYGVTPAKIDKDSGF